MGLKNDSVRLAVACPTPSVLPPTNPLRSKKGKPSGVTPSLLRTRTVVGTTDSAFQRDLQPDGYVWRFDAHSPGGHLFDDMVHKYATALWFFDQDIRRVQAVVRRGPIFFEAPTANGPAVGAGDGGEER